MQNRSADLALAGLTKLYGNARAVDGVTLRVGTGEMVALLGPSGCGKTTTLRMVAGLVEPSEGEILIGGNPVTHMPVHKRNIGMLFQNYALFPHLSVARNVAFGLEMRGIRKTDAARRVNEALALVQLGHLADRLPHALSGGQQQRVALARALVIEPSVLLLDEPLGALDKGLRESMQVELRLLQRRLGITAVIVTHDQEEALTMADRIVIMRGGRLEQVGTPLEVYARPTSRFVAAFIGAANFLHGRVVGEDSEATLVELSDGIRLSVAAAARTDLRAGTSRSVTVNVRPEAISVRTLPSHYDPSPNQAPATIEQIVYRGALTHLHLRLDGGCPLLAHQQNGAGAIYATELAPGTRVLATWAQESISMVNED